MKKEPMAGTRLPETVVRDLVAKNLYSGSAENRRKLYRYVSDCGRMLTLQSLKIPGVA
jgi:hypothetical protein